MVGRRGKTTLLARLREPRCRRCLLHKSSCHVCILGRGDPMSPVMLIGEAPGEAEARTGKPFMGRSGQLLNQLIRRAGLDPNRVYITNVCRCRPPENRTPEENEIEACKHFLHQEIRIVAPRAILLLGSTARDAFGHSRKEMSPESSPIYIAFPFWAGNMAMTWHPAYCLRTGPGTQQEMLGALRWLKLWTKE